MLALIESKRSIIARRLQFMRNSFEMRCFIGSYNEAWQDAGFHTNTTLEIEIVLEGRGFFESPERKVAVEAGHIVVISPGIPHRFGADGKIRLGVIHLDHMPAPLAETAEKLGYRNSSPQLSALSRIDLDRFDRLFREWLRIASSMLKERERHMTVWGEVLLLFLLEHSRPDVHAMTITKAADYLREHLRQNVRMSDLAELSGMTVAGFRRTFEKIYGTSPKRYQQQCRVQEAKWLLSATDKDINEIAGQVGFHRMHSFSQWFKSIAGVSPSAWRREQKRQTEPGSGNRESVSL
jgi:AraC-like DNA-binding protein